MHYYSFEKEFCSELIERKSKFITLLFPVCTLEEAEKILNDIRVRYPGANHYCSALVLRQPVRMERYSDDGEPSGTAGMPILGVLKHNELEDVLAVVIRYFGGILLGAAGLIRTYSESASRAVQTAGRQRFTLCQEIRLVVEYSFLGLIQNRLLKEGVVLQDILYEDMVDIRLFIPMENADAFARQAVLLTNNSILIEMLETRYIPL